MELGLNGKTIVITGSKGIGLAGAQAFLAEEGLKLDAKTRGVSEEQVLASGQASVPLRRA
jgi:NAD(P)-dependent dehydrogenase (short-subunit alcohol dehydrogenase family)